MTSEPRVVVVGGGPAGLAAAIAIARHGVPTWLVEQNHAPLDKPCGEGLLASAVRGLTALGVGRHELEQDGARIEGIRYFSPRGRSAQARFEPGALSLGMRRVRLSELLLERARRLPALSIRFGTRAEVVLDAGRATIELAGARLRPALVLGADGLNSGVRRACGIALRVGARRRYGVRQHFALESWTDHVEVYFARGVEAYVTPLRFGMNVAFLWSPAEIELSPGRAPFAQLLQRFPALERRLDGAEAQDRASGAGPFDQHPAERARPGLALVGDAGGYIDALTGEGVGLAVTQALALERAVVPHLVSAQGNTRPVPLGALQGFLALADAVTASNRQLTRLLLELVDRPSLLEPAIALLGASERLFRYFLSANSGLFSAGV
jgi:2-polyprenyl-6-methoxyphenol hydroxylase-like FAD-dependent oxidoreductase